MQSKINDNHIDDLFMFVKSKKEYDGRQKK